MAWRYLLNHIGGVVAVFSYENSTMDVMDEYPAREVSVLEGLQEMSLAMGPGHGALSAR